MRKALLYASLFIVVAGCNGGVSSGSGEAGLDPAGSPFIRLIAHSVAYDEGAALRPSAAAVSELMTERQPRFSTHISLGLVFFGQFVDHDITRNQTVPGGQGPSSDPLQPINVRSPAVDLDSMYGPGPADTPQFYSSDGLFFQLGTGERDLLRDANGRAVIADDRNDENGLVGQIHLAMEKFHNARMHTALAGRDPGALSAADKAELFTRVRRYVTAFFQGIVTHEMAVAYTGAAVPENEPPLRNIPAEFACAAFRLGHTLVPNTVRTEHGSFNPVDAALRSADRRPALALLFGPHAQPAAALDDQISDVMHKLIIPVSPASAAEGEFVGGTSPNIGNGHIIDGNLVLDLPETNILRGREQRIVSGEEYLAAMEGRPYNPAIDGNTDLFYYVLREAAPLDQLGKTGTDIFQRTIGGILAADPNRYFNPELFSPEEITTFRSATFEQVLHEIGEAGF